MDQFRYTSGPVEACTSDQIFLLNFIMGNYLGPDVKTDIPRRSASQRMAEGLPPYDISDLCSTVIKRSDVASLYYYVLRNAHPSAVMKLQSLDLYFLGNLPPQNMDNAKDVCMFTSLFPLDMHDRGRYEGSFDIFNGIVIIDDPDISHIKPEDLQRFKWLTAASELKIDKIAAQLYRFACGTFQEQNIQKTNNKRLSMEASMEEVTTGNDDASQQSRNPFKRICVGDIPQLQTSSHMAGPSCVNLQSSVEGTPAVKTTSSTEPAMLVLGSMPKIEHWSSVTSTILTGTAKAAKVGPTVGRVDVATNKTGYFFQVALPGVKKDEGQFFCDIQSNGKVQIRGVTTGERTVLRKSRVFQMLTNQFCPPGPFQVSFWLPGPVEPRLFSGDFRSDGILEGVVIKCMERINTMPLVFD